MSEENSNKSAWIQWAGGFILTIATTLVTAGIFTGSLSTRVGTLEEDKKDIKQKLDKIDDKLVDKERYNSDQLQLMKTLDEIKTDFKDLRNKTDDRRTQ